MSSRPSGGSRRASTAGTDGRSLETALAASSLLLWLPYSLAAVYVAYCSAFAPEQPHFTGGVSASSSSAGGSRSSATAYASDGGSYASSSASSGTALPAASTTTTYGGGGAIAPAPRYNAVYYRIFPADFDIAVFVPLLLRVAAFSTAAILATYFLSVHKHNGGEYLMAVAWALGTFSGYGWLNSSVGSVLPSPAVPGAGSRTALPLSAPPPSWLWLAVSLLTGLFSGILCKVKDIVDGKHARDTHLFPLFDRSDDVVVPRRSGRHRTQDGDGGARASSTAAPAATVPRYRRIRMSTSHHLGSLGDRLYMVVPFCTGQWFSFILHHGWRGIVVENGTILLSLSLVGYTMLSYKFLKRQLLRVSGQVARSATARTRTRRHKLRQQQQQQQQQQQGTSDDATHSGGAAAAASDDDVGADDVLSADGADDLGEVAVVDVIELISKLFTTSFGVVVLVVLGLNVFMTSLCIPFLKALFKLNALVSGVGIVIELIMYEVA
ncbi:hypothetical protein NESM_000859000 [Novymonas esmeraldas]|uniref:Uncharacterized protein n=1 Tax=Novymonas esmeraldas TaxID=1808958 RepID=A0AAW0EZH2_9TRYP